MQPLPQSVLIIDDSEPERYLIRRFLKKAGVTKTIFEAQHGQQALQFLTDQAGEAREKHPDDFPPTFILLDINMPIMGGFEFLEEFAKLRVREPWLSTVVFVMLSSSERPEDVQRAMKYDFVKQYLSKAVLSAESLRQLLVE